MSRRCALPAHPLRRLIGPPPAATPDATPASRSAGVNLAWRLRSTVVPRAHVDVTAGRDAEIVLARQALAAVARGSSSTVLVEGEAGIGKSHLLRHIRADALDIGLQVVTGACHLLERSRPFGVIADAFDLWPPSADGRRAAIGRLLVVDESASRPADARFRVVDEILELVQSDHVDRPLVVLLEDLHWADESSLMAIRSIVHELAHLPLLLAATYRPSPRSPELDLLVDDCLASGALLMQLRALSAEEVDVVVAAELGASAGPLLSSIVGRANGNPLWIVELLRSLSAEGWLRREAELVEAAADELPRTLRDLVLRRLRYLPPGVLDVLRLAAVLGESVSIRDLATVASRASGAVVADLAEAFRARLLDEEGEVVAFRHQLVQQAIYEDLPVPVRRRCTAMRPVRSHAPVQTRPKWQAICSVARTAGTSRQCAGFGGPLRRRRRGHHRWVST